MKLPHKLKFTKMHGAGNDFVVLDATREPLDFSAAQFRFIADRRFGIGADQILIVGPSPAAGIDFSYRIINADGGEVEQCGNGARCFARFVADHGLSSKQSIKVRTVSGVIEPHLQLDGRVTVDMGAPIFEPALVPFHSQGLQPHPVNDFELWPLALGSHAVDVAVVSMGNPHAVLNIARLGLDDLDTAPVADLGPQIEGHTLFPKRVNAGFMQVLARDHIKLRGAQAVHGP